MIFGRSGDSSTSVAGEEKRNINGSSVVGEVGWLGARKESMEDGISIGEDIV